MIEGLIGAIIVLMVAQHIRIEHRLTKLEILVKELINLNGRVKHDKARRKDK